MKNQKQPEITEEQIQKMRETVKQEVKAVLNKAEYQLLKGLTNIFKKAKGKI